MVRVATGNGGRPPAWGARLLLGGGLLVALLAASIVGYGHASPQSTYCYTNCNITVTASVASNSATSGGAPLTVSFQGAASGGTSPYSWSWTFGDESTSNAQNPTYTFTQVGTYNVVLTVQDAAGNTGTSQTVQITVGGGPSQAGSNAMNDGELAALVAAVVIVAVVAVAVVLLILHRRKGVAVVAAGAGLGAAAYEPAPPVYGGAAAAGFVPYPPAQDPTSMEPPAEGVPPPPSSDDIPAQPQGSWAPPPPPSSDDIPAR